jgi:hypothetical protein
MNSGSIDIRHAIQQVRDLVGKADAEIIVHSGGADVDQQDVAEHLLESAYLHLLVLTEALNLSALRKRIAADYKKSRSKLLSLAHHEGEFFFAASNEILRYVHALEAAFGISSARHVERDLHSILRNMEYAISDAKVFGGPPRNEGELHRRVEAILRCFFPGEVLTKPPIGKSIKNFEADTGIPSLETLIEYKFIARQPEVPRVAEQILADTRGYKSRNWSHFIFLVYEVQRFKPEAEWNRLLSECESAAGTTVIVIRGTGLREKRLRQSGVA